MNPRDAYATAFRLTALAAKLARVETTAAATGRPLPADWPVTVAVARASTRSFKLALTAEQARRRFAARYPNG